MGQSHSLHKILRHIQYVIVQCVYISDSKISHRLQEGVFFLASFCTPLHYFLLFLIENLYTLDAFCPYTHIACTTKHRCMRGRAEKVKRSFIHLLSSWQMSGHVYILFITTKRTKKWKHGRVLSERKSDVVRTHTRWQTWLFSRSQHFWLRAALNEIFVRSLFALPNVQWKSKVVNVLLVWVCKCF